MADIRNRAVTAQDDATTRLNYKGRIDRVSAATGPNSPATADFVIEASWDKGVSWVTPIQLTDPTTPGAYVGSLIGPGKAGYAELGGADAVRARRTDATGGNGDIALTIRDIGK